MPRSSGRPPGGLRPSKADHTAATRNARAPTQRRNHFVSGVMASHWRPKGSVYHAHADCASVNRGPFDAILMNQYDSKQCEHLLS